MCKERVRIERSPGKLYFDIRKSGTPMKEYNCGL
jgi:hypothetical protein